MKFLLKVEINEHGNKVFSKKRNGNKYIYLAKDENNNKSPVDKEWILANRNNIVNLGISGNNIYPIEINRKKDVVYRKQLEIVKSTYEKVFSEFSVSYDNCYLEYSGRTSDGGEIVRGIEMNNLYDLNYLFKELYDIANNFDADYEAKVSTNMLDFQKDCSEISDEDIAEDDAYRYLQWRYEAMVDYQEKLKNMTFGWKSDVQGKGYDNNYAVELLDVYGNKELSDVIQMW